MASWSPVSAKRRPDFAWRSCAATGRPAAGADAPWRTARRRLAFELGCGRRLRGSRLITLRRSCGRGDRLEPFEPQQADGELPKQAEGEARRFLDERRQRAELDADERAVGHRPRRGRTEAAAKHRGFADAVTDAQPLELLIVAVARPGEADAAFLDDEEVAALVAFFEDLVAGLDRDQKRAELVQRVVPARPRLGAGQKP